jgi:ubiquinone biosynthesis accessory factor UbiK
MQPAPGRPLHTARLHLKDSRRMTDTRIDELVRSFMGGLPPALRGFSEDLETNFRAVLRANLSRLDLVARDEFDAQARLLLRTRERLEQLEKRLAELEAERAQP